MNEQPPKYSFRLYNKYDVLRPNWMFWAIVVFLSRHLIFFLLLGASHGRRGGTPNPAAGALVEPLYFIADFPAIILFLVLGARLPGGRTLSRFIWRNGWRLLLSSAVLFFCLLVWKEGFDLTALHPVNWVTGLINALVIGGLLKSSYLKDLFREFPAPVPDEKK